MMDVPQREFVRELRPRLGEGVMELNWILFGHTDQTVFIKGKRSRDGKEKYKIQSSSRHGV